MPGYLKKIFLSVFLFCSLSLHAQYTIADFKELHSLKGKWKMTTKKGLLYEQWFFVNDSTLQNRSYRLHGLDTIPQETVTLKIRGGSITYNSTVADENNQLPVTFTLTSRLQGKYLFENQSHDFPQFIRYQLLGEHKLSAAISGKMNGNFREVLFMYDREL